MLGLQHRLRRREDDVVAKIMDGEVVVIDLTTGVYYSIDGAGAAIWGGIEDGLSLGEIAAALARRYQIESARAEADVLRLAAELAAEDLVVVADAAASRVAELAASADEAAQAYVEPRLTSYRDMEDLLALDPPTPGLADLRWKE